MISVIDSPETANLIKRLKKIYLALKQEHPLFPFPVETFGREASYRVAEKCPEAGICGGLLNGRPHVWNTFKRGEVYVDISAAPFKLPDIFVLPRNEAISVWGYVPSKIITQEVLIDRREKHLSEYRERIIEELGI
jgi:hypothetical protein